MPNVRTDEAFPSGYGLLTGLWLGLALGIIAFLVSANVSIGLIAFVTTGTALGIGLERGFETRPPTPRERRLAVVLGIVGVAAGGIVFFVLFD